MNVSKKTKKNPTHKHIFVETKDENFVCLVCMEEVFEENKDKVDTEE